MGLNRAQCDYLELIYYDTAKTGSFRGVQSLYNIVRREKKHEITRKQVSEWLKGQQVYTRWHPARTNYKRNPIRPLYPGHILQIDLADFHKEKEFDKKSKMTFQYLMIAVDSFSRYVFAVPLNNRKSENIIAGMEVILKTGFKPTTCMADPAGTNFLFLRT